MNKKEAEVINEELKAWLNNLLDKAGKYPGKNYPLGVPVRQFALLELGAASECGVKLCASVHRIGEDDLSFVLSPDIFYIRDDLMFLEILGTLARVAHYKLHENQPKKG